MYGSPTPAGGSRLTVDATAPEGVARTDASCAPAAASNTPRPPSHVAVNNRRVSRGAAATPDTGSGVVGEV